MWGNIVLDTFNQTLFTTSFINMNADTLLHLSQWQYWWWFWFSYVFILYYILIFKIVTFRNLKFNPKIATTNKSHGKWGDLIICALPLYWCLNILSNSNSLLKIVEWQTESSILTLRIRGKQWYWVYKLDLLNNLKLLNTRKLIGHNKYVSPTPTDKLILGTGAAGLENLWQTRFFNKNTSYDDVYIDADSGTIVDNNNADMFSQHSPLLFNTVSISKNTQVSPIAVLQSMSPWLHIRKPIITSNYLNNALYQHKYNPVFAYKKTLFQKHAQNNYNTFPFTTNLQNITLINKYNFKVTTLGPLAAPLLDNTLGLLKKKPTTLMESKTQYLHNNTIKLVKIDFNDPLNRLVKLNYINQETSVKNYARYWITLKQKPYKNWKNTNFTPFYTNQFYNKHLVSTESYNLYIKNSFLYKEQRDYNLYNNNRLLSTNRVLVLPTNINITIITNSFDVVHSWFIPGLGIKMDCVPGRSTHHSFYIDTPGFYYGQCAEICGRFHHHMPIKICAMSFEHFILWWYHFTYRLNLITNDDKAYNVNLSKYSTILHKIY